MSWACHKPLSRATKSYRVNGPLVLLTASRVTENRQIRKNTKEIWRSELRSGNKIAQKQFIFNRKFYYSTFCMLRIGSFGPPIRIKYKLEY